MALLAHLISQFRGKQEDIATLSLQYILSQSPELRDRFTQEVSSLLSISLDPLEYRCQVTGSEGERPDMAGYDIQNQEQVLFEMKFYAGLTDNQPNGYLERARKNHGKGLLFICPEVRRTRLWAELKDICREQTPQNISTYCMDAKGIRLGISTWPELLTVLRDSARSLSPDIQGDIKQLEGLCAQMDRDAFIPFTEDDLSADMSPKLSRYYQVVDETIALLQTDENHDTSKKSFKPSQNSDYYSRKVFLDGFIIELMFNRYLWAQHASRATPFWLDIYDVLGEHSLDYSPELLHKCNIITGGLEYFPLTPLPDVTLDKVCQNLKEQILQYVNALR